MISYYELLIMIRNRENPKKVKFDGVPYLWNGSTYQNEYTSCILKDGFNEVDMFKHIIEIEDDNINA